MSAFSMSSCFLDALLLSPEESVALLEGGPASADPKDAVRTACPGGGPAGGAGGNGTGERADLVLLGVAEVPDGCVLSLLADVTELDCTRCHLLAGAGGCIGPGSAIVTCMGVGGTPPGAA